MRDALVFGFAIACLIAASVAIRAHNEKPGALEPIPEQTIRCTTEPLQPEPQDVEPVVFIAQTNASQLCPSDRDQRVLRLRSLYRAHLREVRCG